MALHLRAPAILLSARNHGETAVIARLLTEDYGLIAAYVAGGRGRILRPIVIPGNLVAADLRAKSDSHLPFARLELVQSRGPWLGEALPAAAISWVTALAASVLPERNAYPVIYDAMVALLDAICNAPSARGWLPGLVGFESLMLRELGYGARAAPPFTATAGADLVSMLAAFDAMLMPIEKHLLVGTYGEIIAARKLLHGRLSKIEGAG